MGILWTVWPLDESMKIFLDDSGIKYPSDPSRFPTGTEIKTVIGSLTGFNVEIYDNGPNASFQASIVSKMGGDAGEWTLLNIKTYTGDDEEQKLWFEKGWESLIKRILKELSKASGPLVLIDDASSTPQIIEP